VIAPIRLKRTGRSERSVTSMDRLQIVRHYVEHKWLRTFRSRRALERMQQRRLTQHLRFVHAHSPFYNASVSEAEATTLSAYPIVTKETMMRQFDCWNTVGLTHSACMEVARQAEQNRDFSPTLGSITVGLSSGSSGQYGIFLVSPRERVQWAGGMLAKALPRGLFHRERIAFFLRANSNLYETVEQTRLQFRYFDLMQSSDTLCAALARYKPTMIIAPPSMLVQIMDYFGENNEALKDVIRVYSVAEILEDDVRNALESWFGMTMHQVYQATEGFLGITCAHGCLHLNEDVLYIEKEYIDEEKTRFYPIVTDLYRTSQPFVRFRLNDILVEQTSPCACGSVFTPIARIEGRSDDVFVFDGVNGEQKSVFPDFIRKWFMEISEGLRDYKVVQQADGHVHVYLDVLEESARPMIQQQVTEAIGQFCLTHQVHPFELRWFPKFESERGRKIRRIESRVT
ncbi:MAG: F390 synthetase-related protein, partial [Bacilli bacterium]